jgi:hypothetical protein
MQNATGSACTIEGMMSKNNTGQSLICANNPVLGTNSYVAMNTIIRTGSVGYSCGVAGAMAIDTQNNNEALICRSNLADGTGALRLMRIRDITSTMVFVTAWEVTYTGVAMTVPKPVCQDSASHPATPVIQLIPKVFSASDGGFSFYADDPGGMVPWVVHMEKGSGAVMDGSPIAIAQTFCSFN